ncbi:hypothetical protein [Euzebya tangerina]|uniref:hypothetical protein n=1 Tax=Euzebya tangerina TaxID=591198 RepID=UPI0013C312FF|nr:hypothetical protein [Euzebya tangerina]
MDVDAWESQEPAELPLRSRAASGRLILGLLAGVALVAWLATSPSTIVQPDDAELALATEQPPPPTIDRVTFLGNSLSIDNVRPPRDSRYVSVQWGGGSIAVPSTGDGPGPDRVYYVCGGDVVRVAAAEPDLPTALVIAGAGIHSRLVGCSPNVPDVPLDSTGVASWSLPVLMRLNNSAVTADLANGEAGALDATITSSTDESLRVTLRAAFAQDGHPTVGSRYADFAGGEVLLFGDTRYLQCDRGTMLQVTGQTELLSTYLGLLDCVPTAPARPRDPMDELRDATDRLVTALDDTAVQIFDISPHRPAIRFTVSGPAGEVRMLALTDVTADRAGDRPVPVGDGEVIRRRDGGTVAACGDLILAIDPEYEPIAIPTLRAVADSGACTLARPASMPT